MSPKHKSTMRRYDRVRVVASAITIAQEKSAATAVAEAGNEIHQILRDMVGGCIIAETSGVSPVAFTFTTGISEQVRRAVDDVLAEKLPRKHCDKGDIYCYWEYTQTTVILESDQEAVTFHGGKVER